MSSDDIFRGIGVEILLAERGDFLKVRETLTRIGEADPDENKLYQLCYILHKQGRYVIAHYRELLFLDGMSIVPTEDDIAVRNTIAGLLEKWGSGLGVTVVDKDRIEAPRVDVGELTILTFRDKEEWNLIEQYKIGRRKAAPYMREFVA